eukprot:515347-Pelagomonas_calceolata.AAC.6
MTPGLHRCLSQRPHPPGMYQDLLVGFSECRQHPSQQQLGEASNGESSDVFNYLVFQDLPPPRTTGPHLDHWPSPIDRPWQHLETQSTQAEHQSGGTSRQSHLGSCSMIHRRGRMASKQARRIRPSSRVPPSIPTALRVTGFR